MTNLRSVIKKKLYPQRCSATPLLLISAGGSGFDIPQPRGIKYSAFLYVCQKEDGIMTYLWDDLVSIDRVIKIRLKRDRGYYRKLKSCYERDWCKATSLFKKIDALVLSNLTFAELSELARKASHAIALAVGVAHMIEPYAIAGDQRIRKEVQIAVGDPALANRIFLSQTTPRVLSFAARIEKSINWLAEKETVTEADIQRHLRSFFWAQNSYSGRRNLSVVDVRRMISEYKSQKKNVSEEKIPRPSLKVEPYHLSEFLSFELETLAFLSVWQDERKRNILIGIDYLERVLEVIAERTGVPITLLRYLTPRELSHDPNAMESTLAERRQGSVFLQTKGDIEIGLGADFARFRSVLAEEENIHETELRGTSASVGKVVGRVKVCPTPDSMEKVEEGDILVTSMTRPEYLPAMRRAAAFVTDEGGITCHAAIVAREMGKPCVIGTRFATRFLKDNDLVEVKGNHGVVIVLEKTIQGNFAELSVPRMPPKS